MNVRTRRWLLAPIRQWRTHQLIRRHGPSLDYPTAWALITWPRGHVPCRGVADHPAVVLVVLGSAGALSGRSEG